MWIVVGVLLYVIFLKFILGDSTSVPFALSILAGSLLYILTAGITYVLPVISMRTQPITQTAPSRTHRETRHLPSRRTREMGTEISHARMQCQHADLPDRRRRGARLICTSGPDFLTVLGGQEGRQMAARSKMERDELRLVFGQPASQAMGKEEGSKNYWR
jgi:hypothetical protein